MIRKEDGELICECECGETFPGGTEDNFRTFVQHVRDAGWKIRKDEDGTWLHICPGCQEE